VVDETKRVQRKFRTSEGAWPQDGNEKQTKAKQRKENKTKKRKQNKEKKRKGKARANKQHE